MLSEGYGCAIGRHGSLHIGVGRHGVHLAELKEVDRVKLWQEPPQLTSQLRHLRHRVWRQCGTESLTEPQLHPCEVVLGR